MKRPPLRRIRALVLDVDGVLTDGGMYYGAQGESLKKFNVKDGMGIRMVGEAGIAVAFMTGETGEAVLRRAEKLKVRDVFLGVEDKARAFMQFLDSHSIGPDQAAYVGDDLNDLPAMSRAGVAIAVADAVPEVRDAADWVLNRKGGEAAVREVCDALLASRAGTSRAPRSRGPAARR